MNYSDLELAQLQAETLYVYDTRGRMLRLNEPDPQESAPRFFLVRTLAGNLLRTRSDLLSDVTAELELLASDEPVARNVGELREPPRHILEYTRLLEQHASGTNIYAGPAYYLPELNPPANVVAILPENADLLETNFPYTRSRLAERSPVVAIIGEGVAVAACYSARTTVQVAEAGVYTEEHYRGRGYAEQTVRAWAAHVQAMNKLALYSTSWKNVASRAVASKLGAVFYAVDLSLT